MEKKKRTVWHWVICVGLVCLIWGGYSLIMHYVNDRILEVEEDDFSWVCQVDLVKEEKGDFILQGFAFEVDKDAIEGKFRIVLQDIETGKRYFPKMRYMDRIDVNEYFWCEYDYLHSGFETTINANRLDLEKKNYEVLLKMAGERKTYRTGTYISEGQLMYTEPLEFESLEVEETALEEVVEGGVLRVYRPDYGMYVYQYEGELYWIAEPEYGFVEGDTYVQYGIETTQINRLPQIRLDNQMYWDDIGFVFSTHELLGVDTGKYRVAKAKLPTVYSIDKIGTGNYIKGSFWSETFRPYYVFE